MKEELISFATAKLAKEKGFNIKPKGYFDYYNEDSSITQLCGIDFTIAKGCLAPTQSLLQKWLREEHNIDIEIKHRFLFDQKDYYVVLNIKSMYIHFSTYEEALEAGLQEALKLIK